MIDKNSKERESLFIRLRSYDLNGNHYNIVSGNSRASWRSHEKRSKSLQSSNSSKTKGSNEASANSGIIHVVLEVDVEKLKEFIINGLS